MKEMVKMSMSNGGVNRGGNGAQQFFDGMVRQNNAQAHNMMHGPKF